MKSLNAMVKQVCALADCDVTDWENGFLDSIEERTDDGCDVSMLTAPQIAVIERIYNKHFA